jgi:threonine dehydratase
MTDNCDQPKPTDRLDDSPFYPRVDLADIRDAHRRIRNRVHRTPVHTCSTLNRLAGCELFFKCENFQRAGAFKFRGASNAVLSLTDEDAACGVVTHSSGNHAQALALAARLRGIKARIVMPTSAPPAKVAAVIEYGGEITFCEPTLEARERGAQAVIQEHSSVLIHPYNDERIIAGQGTAALELLEQTDRLDAVLAPVGGGGLLSGTAIACKESRTSIKVFGCEPAGADDAYRSFHAGVIQPALAPNTIADGLLTSLGDKTFAVIRRYVDDILLVGESQIIEAMKLVWERMKLLIEPSAAVPVAAALQGPSALQGLRVGIILSGGNADLAKVPF